MTGSYQHEAFSLISYHKTFWGRAVSWLTTITECMLWKAITGT